MSLRLKYLLAAGLSVLVPFLAYLFVDATLTRSFLIRDHVDALRLAAELLHSSLDLCQADCPRTAQRLLGHFARAHPDLEVMLLDERSRVVAATKTSVRGQTWNEEGIARVLRGETGFSWATMEHHGDPVLDVTMPWRDRSGRVLGAIHLGRSLAVVEARLRATRLRHAAFVGIVALAVGVFLSLITYRTVIRPLGRLDAELHAAHPQGAGTSAEAHRALAGDEIAHLALGLRSLVSGLASTADRLRVAAEEKDALLERVAHFNEELGREVERTRRDLLGAQQELMRAEQMATIGQLTAGLAHELRNPLFIVRGTAESFRRRHPDAASLADDIIEEVDRVDRIIGRLMDLARPLQLELERIDLGQLLEEVVAEARRAHPVELEQECDGRCATMGDRAYLRQALMHLVDNARRAVGASGGIVLRARHAEPDWIEIAVEDTGGGIAPEDLAHVFEPFFSRRAGGTGLGLCATKKILDLHGATIAVQSEVGRGTRFTVRLAAAPDGEEAE